MCKKLLILGFNVLAVAPTLKIFEQQIQNKNSASNYSRKSNPLIEGLNVIKTSIEQIYKQNFETFNRLKNEQQAINLYRKIVSDQKKDLQFAYEDKFESAWYWFGYWKWFATWNGFISTISDMTGAGLDAYDTWSTIQPSLYAALLTYLGTSGAIPVVGWVMSGAAAVLATSIIGAISGHRLWESPQREKGIVMSFYLVIYSGSWLQD